MNSFETAVRELREHRKEERRLLLCQELDTAISFSGLPHTTIMQAALDALLDMLQHGEPIGEDEDGEAVYSTVSRREAKQMIARVLESFSDEWEPT